MFNKVKAFVPFVPPQSVVQNSEKSSTNPTFTTELITDEIRIVAALFPL